MRRGVSNWERILSGAGLNFLPDALAILPNQWRAHHRYTPERQLLLTVLQDALVALRKGDPEEIREVEEWISGADARIPFKSLCEFLDLELGYVRGRLGRLIASFREGRFSDPLARPAGLHHHHARGTNNELKT